MQLLCVKIDYMIKRMGVDFKKRFVLFLLLVEINRKEIVTSKRRAITND